MGHKHTYIITDQQPFVMAFGFKSLQTCVLFMIIIATSGINKIIYK